MRNYRVGPAGLAGPLELALGPALFLARVRAAAQVPADPLVAAPMAVALAPERLLVARALEELLPVAAVGLLAVAPAVQLVGELAVAPAVQLVGELVVAPAAELVAAAEAAAAAEEEVVVVVVGTRPRR